jgi:stress response protein SCP2
MRPRPPDCRGPHVLTGADQQVEDGFPASATGAGGLRRGTTEQSLLVAQVYRRGERWRVRSVGQGYDDGLRELAVRYGVDVE